MASDRKPSFEPNIDDLMNEDDDDLSDDDDAELEEFLKAKSSIIGKPVNKP